jgi:hypothetical protein
MTTCDTDGQGNRYFTAAWLPRRAHARVGWPPATIDRGTMPQAPQIRLAVLAAHQRGVPT